MIIDQSYILLDHSTAYFTHGFLNFSGFGGGSQRRDPETRQLFLLTAAGLGALSCHVTHTGDCMDLEDRETCNSNHLRNTSI